MEKKIELKLWYVHYPVFTLKEFVLSILTLGLSDEYYTWKRMGEYKLLLYADGMLTLIKDDDEVIHSEVVDIAAFSERITQKRSVKLGNKLRCFFYHRGITYFSK